MPKIASLRDRLFEKIIFEPNSGCWLWTGCGDGRYGQIWDKTTMKKAHRVMWELGIGPIPNGIEVCHKCDIGFCCNPDHLFLGTHQDNMIDMVRKGRQTYEYGQNANRFITGKWCGRYRNKKYIPAAERRYV